MLFNDDLQRMVLKLTEEEKLNDDSLDTKQSSIKHWGDLALDDFGLGYNGEPMLLYITPDFVKIDISIVRDVDIDRTR